MSLQADLMHPEFGYFDERLNLTELTTYEKSDLPFGIAQTLHPVAYRSKIFLELENEHIWTRDWVAIGLTHEIKSSGDLLPFTVGFHGIHVQRLPNKSIQARFNRHQHGGCRFVPVQCRTGKQTKCTIASCNYTRDAPAMKASKEGGNSDEMYKFLGLVPEKLRDVAYTTIGPVIFVNVNPQCLPLSDDFEITNALSEGWRENDNIDVKFEWQDHSCNWKLFGKEFMREALWDNPPAWRYPNLLNGQIGATNVIAILQSTGPGNTLVRCFVSGGSPEDLKAALKQLQIIGSAASQEQIKLSNWNTSSRPETIGSTLPTETNKAAYEMHRYLITRVTAVHEQFGNAPIMDARMLQRGRG
jgi:hypothetical protein